LGISPEEIGVIGFYKAQVGKIISWLSFEKETNCGCINCWYISKRSKRCNQNNNCPTQSSLFLEASERINAAKIGIKKHWFLILAWKLFYNEIYSTIIQQQIIHLIKFWKFNHSGENWKPFFQIIDLNVQIIDSFILQRMKQIIEKEK
jgi:hypothetical protein